MLSITDTLTRGRVTLAVPADRAFTLYSCGPTVYRDAHIGNLRTFLVTDLVRRALAWRDVPVRSVQNITDVGHLTDDHVPEDKILRAADEERRTVADIAEHYTQAYRDDADDLNLLRFDHQPRATEHIPHMLDLIERLMAAGHAYDTPTAVYFSVASFPAYGALSGNRPAELQPGHRSDHVDPNKRFHGDFALWRKAGPRRQAVWDSPWGPGFPGWHVECSAMSLAYLGPHVDLHLGGVDLVFPHHESEVAQSEAAVGHPVVGAWLHAEHLLADGRKMAKSTGNVVGLADIRDRGHDPLAFRLLCLQARYRTQTNFTWAALQGAQRHLDRLRTRTSDLAEQSEDAPPAHPAAAAAEAAVAERFIAAVEDDLDTPTALRLAAQTAAGEGAAAQLNAASRLAVLRRMDAILALDLDPFERLARKLPDGAGELLRRRTAARGARDYATADALRDELARMGLDVRDSEGATVVLPRGPTPVDSTDLSRRPSPRGTAPA